MRDEAAAALRGRADTLPWLRRAARSTDRDTAQRAAALLAPHEPKRQAAVAQAIDACIRDGRADLFMEWHHYWQPENKDELWTVGPRMAQAGQDEFAKWCPPSAVKRFEETFDLNKFKLKPRSYDGPLAQMPRKEWAANTALSIRTDLWRSPRVDLLVAFASVAGSAKLGTGGGGAFSSSGQPRARICG